LNNHKGMAGCRFVLAAALAVALAGRLKCAEFEVMDVLRVDGYAVLESSVDITGNRFYVGGSSFAVAYGKIGIGTSTPSFPLQVSAAPGTAGEMLVISTGASNVIRLTGAGEVYANRFYGDISGASGFSGGDNLGSHIATTTLQMGAYGVNTSSNITAARYQINGSTMVAILPGVDSIAYGVYAGTSNITGGNYNVFVGNSAGASNTTGTQNSFVGAYAGYSNTTASENSFFGYYAGYKNTTGIDNSFLSRAAGYFNTTGTQNSFVGSTAGYSNSTGKNNSIMGTFAGLYNQTGSANSIFGSEAGGFNNWGGSGSFSSSTIVGYQAGNKVTTGGDNILVGYRAGYGVTTGTGNIVIGYNKDTSAPGASNELNIGGLVYGDLSAKTVGINRVAQQAALDVVSTGTTGNQYAQIWRDSTGLIVSSMSATGVLMAAKFVGDGSGLTGLSATGDNLGSHVATTTLNMAGFQIKNVSSMTISAPDTLPSSLWVSTSATTPHLYVSTNGNIGVGTGAPLVNFHVHASAAGTLGPRLLLSNTGGAGSQVALDLSTYLPGSNAPGGRIVATDDGNYGSTIAFQNKTPGAMGNSLQTRMIISNTGNIGIGTISPSQKLQVGDGSAPTAAEVRGNGTGYDAGFRIWNTHTFTGASSYLDFGWGAAPAVAAIHARSQTDNSTDLVFQGSNVSKTRSDMLYIDGSNGNIGIGTAAPAADLHISSTSASAAQDMLKISTGTANADVFVVKGNGNVGIGTTPPAYRLAVSSGAGESGTILAVSTGTSTMIELQGDGDVIAKRFIGDGSSLTNVTANAGVYTLAQMNTLAPAAAGRLISVSDAAAPYSYCVSTGTAAGAWVMLNQTIHCQ